MLLSPAARQTRKGPWGGERERYREGERRKETAVGQLISEREAVSILPEGPSSFPAGPALPKLNFQPQPMRF